MTTRPLNKLSIVVVFAVMLFAGGSFGDTAQAKSDLLAHASDQTLWIATIHPPQQKNGEEYTTVRYRSINTADQTWRELVSLPGRVEQVSHFGDSLVVLMSSGEWKLLWPGSDSVGPNLPDRAKMIAVAADRDLLYAIGIPGAGSSATTQTTQPSDSTTAPTATPATASPTEPSATTTPTTQPAIATGQPVLYEFENGTWKPVVNAPPSISSKSSDVSLTVIDRQPTFAQMENDTIGVYQLTDDKAWVALEKIPMPIAPRAIRLLNQTQRPTLWADTGAPAGMLFFGGGKWEKPITLAVSGPVNGQADRTLAQAAGGIRLFFNTDKDKNKIAEQRYDSGGHPNGNITALDTPQPSGPPMMDWPMMALMVGLGFLMLTSIRRQGTSTDDRSARAPADALVLAPTGQRLLAAMIDAIPLIVAMIYVLNAATDPFDAGAISFTLPPLAIALVIYLLHTTLTEVIAGRSLGKMIVGLRVVTAEGATPKASALLVRNLMRLVDVMPLPLGLLVLITPLRQRTGDLIAHTVVILMADADEQHDEAETH